MITCVAIHRLSGRGQGRHDGTSCRLNANRTIFGNEEHAHASRNISLTDHFDGLVERSIRTGRFADASEAVRAGLHLLEHREREEEERRTALKAAAAEGFGALDRGDYVILDGEQALRRKLREVGRAARAGIASTAE